MPNRLESIRVRWLAASLALFLTVVSSACQGPPSKMREPVRSADLPVGVAIAYSGYREGQSPTGDVRPSRGQVAEDLRILEKTWKLIRVYNADPHAEDVLEVVRHENLGLKVMLGIWLEREPGGEQDNARHIADGIRLANEYQDIVVAVNVGNEVLIEWTEHPVPEDRVIRYVRQTRAGVSQPVTVADNYVWWRDHGAALAQEVDFITIHTYPIWEQRDIDEGLSYTIANYEDVRSAHPDRHIVIGEAGWATYTEGNLHVPRAGDETKQQRYYEQLAGWARDNDVTVFFFEAFDEPWKGTGTEGHWGLFTVDRRAKPVMRGLYPELAAYGPTSPDYPDRIAPTGPDIAVVLHAALAPAVRGGSTNPLGPGLSTADVIAVDTAGGGTALRLEFNGESWAGVYIMLGGHDASEAHELTMRLRVPESVARLQLKLEDAGTDAQSVDAMDYVTGRDEHGWSHLRVPLARFDGVDLSRISILGLWNPADRAGSFVAGEVLVDDIRFE